MFLVPTGILAALIARETTGRGQHVRTSLFQGALLYTTQIWTWMPGAGDAFYGTMAKTYPPGVHQEMIFEVADNEYVHASIMSGLAPVKTQDAILGLPDPSDPEKYMMLSPEERAELTPKRRAAYKLHDRDELLAEFRENNHAIEAVESMEVRAWAPTATPHPQLVANDMIADGRRSRARAHHAGRCADPPARRRPARSRGRGRCPVSTTTRSSASSATRPPRSPPSVG